MLEKLLKLKNIEYNTITDTSLMINKGLKSVPQLEVDGVLMNYEVAKVWVDRYND